MDHNCKNFDVCVKTTDKRLDLCSHCYWTFHELLNFNGFENNAVLTFGTSVECLVLTLCVQSVSKYFAEISALYVEEGIQRLHKMYNTTQTHIQMLPITRVTDVPPAAERNKKYVLCVPTHE
jgi:hypothetical protein